MGGGLSLRLAPPLSACSPSGVMTKKPLEPASAEAYPTSTSSAASLSLNALSSGFPSGSRPAPSATSETIAGLPSSAPPPWSLSARRNLSRSSSSLSGDSLAKTCTSSYRSLPYRLRVNASSCSVPIVWNSDVGFSEDPYVESSSRTQQTKYTDLRLFSALLLVDSARIYGVLLVLYPKAFRRCYAAEKRRDFLELMREGLQEGGATKMMRVLAQASRTWC